MKDLLLRFCVLHLILIVIFSANGFAEEKAGLDDTAYLVDADPEFPRLREFGKTGFFSIINIPVEYHGINAGSLKWNNKINIVSDSLIKDDGKFAVFNIFSYDYYFHMMSIKWITPIADIPMQKDSIKQVLGLVVPLRNYEPYIALRKYVLSPEVSDYTITFTENEKESAITGYSLDLRKPLSQTHRFFRTVIEIITIMGLGEALYWSNPGPNRVDWKYDATWHDYSRRFGDGFSLDTNSFNINTVSHTYSGSLYYTAARSNEYGIFASFLFTFSGSLLWEYCGEFREQPSANDMVFTTLGGSILGEGMHNTSIFLENKLPKHFLTTALCFVIDPMRIVNRYLDSVFMEEGFKVNIMFMNPGQVLFENSIRKNIEK